MFDDKDSYRAAQRIAERAMESFKDEHFKPLIEEFSKQFEEKLWNGVRDSLISDTECNIQSEMWYTIDGIIRSILGGDQYYLQKYVLGPNYECDKIRATIAKLIPEELQNDRIKDLEAEIDKLKKDIVFYQRSGRY